MRLIGNIFKTIIGIVTSIVAVGCNIKGEEVKTYYGPAPAPEPQQAEDPEIVPSAKDIDEPPADIYGPPEAFFDEPDPVPEVEEEPPAGIYGPPEGFELQPEDTPSETNENEQDIPLSVKTNHPVPGYNVAPVKLKQDADEQTINEPIVRDIQGKYITLDATLLYITPEKNYRTVKLKPGKNKGIVEGSVGEIYIDDQLVTNGRLKITKINTASCLAITNATVEQLKAATKVVIKIPDNSAQAKPIPKSSDEYRILYGMPGMTSNGIIKK